MLELYITDQSLNKSHLASHFAQVIDLLQREFRRAGLEVFLAAYGVVPTEYECGIIEVVPNAKSRAQLVGGSGVL